MKANPRTPLALLLAAALGCAGPAVDDSATSASSGLLAEVGRAAHRLEIDENLWLQLKYGVEVRELPDLGLEHAEDVSRAAKELLDRLAGVDAQELDHGEWVTLESLRWDLGILAEGARHYWLRFPVTPYVFNWIGVHNLFQTTETADEAGAQRYLHLARQYPAFVDALVRRLTGQQERGIVLPRDEIDLVVPTWKDLLESPETVFPPLGEASPEGLREELARLVDGEIRPAWRRLIDYLEGDYRASAPESVGLAQYPGGADFYAYLIRWEGSLEASPEAIHRLGLERLAVLGVRMDGIRRVLGFDGMRAEFHRRLKSDPRFFAETPAEVEERFMGYVAAIEPAIDAFFVRRPEAPYRVARLSPELEPGMTYGYYIEPSVSEPQGTYYFNGSKLDERSMIGAASLIYHELLPGHHFQVALQTENTSIPEYRRDSWHNAFGEGWAEYASMLAEEMGMYGDPYDLYGRLADESFFAARLVVDTGMNHLGWPRQRAMDFMREHTLASETEIATETLRYAVDIPAQALGYALGSLKIHELRERARQALGERFDIRRFHAAVLDYGSMPLAVLERHVEWFIEEEGE